MRAWEDESTFYRPNAENLATRSDMLIPATSFLLPGLGQWVSGDSTSAAAYSGVAVGSLIFASEARKEAGADIDSDLPHTKAFAERKYILGLQTYQSMGGFSLFHTFRSAVSLRRREGQYEFLNETERPVDLALAPFHFSYFQRPSTWIPLSLGALLNIWILNHPNEDWSHDPLRPADYAFSSAFSWNAGTHEEAVFRGWMMPVLREYWMGDEWANAGQSAIFAAAHLNSTSVPLAQLILGWHLGRVSQANHWTLGESIFIHTWWDVAAFLTIFSMRKNDSGSSPARLHLPPLIFSF